ncbi:MAG: Rieske 2Fe-2S domain-containing protein [Acidobacteriaceae bacterium]|nr:Rieske 2Fe-2S domain-containing protein [Acidobacteriaceae bacterium]MBV9500633.1 Rieske 2Fe-2S domain-containing protein [Acidobacteriaceae bacterium]
MPLVNVKPLSEVPQGAVIEVEANGATYAVCNVDGELHCVDGTCPHAGGPLGQGTLHGNHLVCPLHGFGFDCRTGLNDDDEDMTVQTYRVEVQDGNVLIDVP